MGDFNHIILYSFDPPKNDPTILFARILRGERGIPYDIILGGWEKWLMMMNTPTFGVLTDHKIQVAAA